VLCLLSSTALWARENSTIQPLPGISPSFIGAEHYIHDAHKLSENRINTMFSQRHLSATSAWTTDV